MEQEEPQPYTHETMKDPLFRDITADDYDPEITEIESVCVNCHDDGVTRLFMTRIPFFREVIVASFSCDVCGYRNAELQPGGKIQDRGVSYKVRLTTIEDLNRQVVKTQYANVRIPELDFEIPPGKSSLTTVEGVIDQAVEGLEAGQIIRRIQQPEIAQQIDSFMEKLKELKLMSRPFNFEIDDPSGNSFVQNPFAPEKDQEMIVGHYSRTRDQDRLLGLLADDDDGDDDVDNGATSHAVGQDDGEGFNSKNEVLNFNTNCPNCQSACETHMKLVNIPHFKEVVIMATVCDFCGHKENEVKSSGGIEDKGCRMELVLKTELDLARDVLKSETAVFCIPELQFETEMGTLGGKFTTVEGLLSDVKTQLLDSNPFFHGDSSQPDVVSRLQKFCEKIDQIMKGKMKDVTFVIDDPAGNSYIQNLCTPDPDPQLTVTHYERSFDQNEDLGLNDMRTENYDS